MQFPRRWVRSFTAMSAKSHMVGENISAVALNTSRGKVRSWARRPAKIELSSAPRERSGKRENLTRHEKNKLNSGFQSVSPPSAEDKTTLTRAVFDHFRCPKEFLNFRFDRELPTSSGYFRFGQDTICYGSYRVGVRGTQAGS